MMPKSSAVLHEKLLLPTLRLVASYGEIAVSDAVRFLASKNSLLQALGGVTQDPSGPVHQNVISALRSLGFAGLVEQTRGGRWTITQEGRKVLRSAPSTLDFDYLKKIPAYSEHWETVARDNRRQDYLRLRFEYYACGRLSLLEGSFDAAAVLLAYSLEYHFKAAMSEVENSWTTDKRRLVEKSHNLKGLYRSALQKGLLATSFISLDFLEFAGDHFTRRYPSRAHRGAVEDEHYLN